MVEAAPAGGAPGSSGRGGLASTGVQDVAPTLALAVLLLGQERRSRLGDACARGRGHHVHIGRPRPSGGPGRPNRRPGTHVPDVPSRTWAPIEGTRLCESG